MLLNLLIDRNFAIELRAKNIEAKDFSLVPSKYIAFKNRDENIDFDEKMKTLQVEFKELLKAEDESKKDLLNVFKGLGYEL